MYYKPDDNFRTKLYENRNNIVAGRIGYGYSNIFRYSMTYGMIVGIVFGVFLVIPQIAERKDIKFFISYDNFWPPFITMIVIAIILGKVLEISVKAFAIKKLIESPDLEIDNGTILSSSINNKPAFAVLESDYKAPIPHFINMIYLNLKKPRILKPGNRVYILKTPNSICIIPMSDITGAPVEAEYSYNDTFDIENMVCIYHPGVFGINSMPRALTDESRSPELRNALQKIRIPNMMRALKAAFIGLAVAFLIMFIFGDSIPIRTGLKVVLVIVTMVLSAMVVWIYQTAKLMRRINKSDFVRTVYVEFPECQSWTGNTVIQTADWIDGNLERYSYDCRNNSYKFNFFDTAEVFYKKEIDGVQTLC